MKNLILIIAFVSSCGPLKMDVSKADSFQSIPSWEQYSNDQLDAFIIFDSMYLNGSSCDSIDDFVLDTSLDIDIDSLPICD